MERKPKFDWHPSPRRPRSPSSVSSSSAFSSRLPSFSSDAGDSFVSPEDCFEEDKRESSVYSKEAIAGGYGGRAALQFVIPTSRYAWWRWRRKPRYHLPNVPDPSRASSKPGTSSAHSTLTTCSTNSTITVPSYKEGCPCDFHLTPLTEGEILSSPNLKAFTFNELKRVTRNFRPDSFIGEGAFGNVFKGWINEQTFTASKPGSGMVVAVKKLNPKSFKGHKEWLTEVNYLDHLHHPNLVKLIGFCSDGDKRLLVYEYMPRGSLDNHLFGSQLSAKADVYNFGVVLLELLSGRRAIDRTRSKGEQNLVDWAKPYLPDKRKLCRIMDSKLEGQYPEKGAQAVAMLDLRCISNDARLRPRMSEVLAALEQLQDVKAAET